MANDRARALRKTLTDAERRLWSHLRRRQVEGCKFRRQAPVGPYIVDLLCLSHRLVVEVDGGQHAWRASSDEKRTKWLESQGFAVLRFWNNEVLGETDAVVAAISDALRGRNGVEHSPGVGRDCDG